MRYSTTALAAGVLACCFFAAPAGAWCDLLFKDVAEGSDLIVLVEYSTMKHQPGRLSVVETIKGRAGDLALTPARFGLERYEPRNGDQFLLALGRDGDLVRYIQGTGACSAISILPVRGGKLRARYRVDYDGASKAMSLDQLRAELM